MSSRSIEDSLVPASIAGRILGVSPASFAQRFAHTLPRRMHGRRWLYRLGDLFDLNLDRAAQPCTLCHRPAPRPHRWGPFRVLLHHECAELVEEITWAKALDEAERNAPPYDQELP